MGAEATLKLIPKSVGKERVAIGGNLDEAVQQVAKAGNKKIVVLASGDPLFYGVARYLCDKLGKDRFEVVPHVSSMQLAFARVKESWEDAYLTNLATHPLDRVIEKIRVADTVGLFTSEDYPPVRGGQALLERTDRLFPGLRVRKSRLAGRAGHAGFAERNCARNSSIR